MGFIEDELEEVKKLCERAIDKSKLISCVKSMVRVEIRRTKFKTIVLCIQFTSDYPKCPLLLELKSKTLSDVLLRKMTEVCEVELKKHLQKPQVMVALKFIDNFIAENPLCCCYSEIKNIKTLLQENDEMKIRQKTSHVILKICCNSYYLKVKYLIPDNYPEKCITLDILQTNFPSNFEKYIKAQSTELARQCVEPPLQNLKAKQPSFTIKPSLEIVIKFLINCIKRFPNEKCQFCGIACFPDNPTYIQDEKSSINIDRLYCDHVVHSTCLINYLRKPPFGNKKCKQCQQPIYYDKWTINDRLAEDRWAHKQARERELAEVTDFFQ